MAKKDSGIYLLTESLQVTPTSSGISISGAALPFGQVSRNGMTYIKESVEQVAHTFVGASMLFNHNQDYSIGHIKNAYVEGGQMMYEADLDPDDEVVRKIKRGDINKVSVQVAFDPQKSYTDDQGVTHAWVTEGYEISAVTIPGFVDTSIQMQENFKQEVKNKEHSNEDKQMAEAKEEKTEEKKTSLDSIMKKVEAGDKLEDDEMEALKSAVYPDEKDDDTEEKTDDTSDDEDEKEEKKESDDNEEEEPKEEEKASEDSVVEKLEKRCEALETELKTVKENFEALTKKPSKKEVEKATKESKKEETANIKLTREEFLRARQK